MKGRLGNKEPMVSTMQRVPSRGTPIGGGNTVDAGVNFGSGRVNKNNAKSANSRSSGGSNSNSGFMPSEDEKATPLILLARRIREEQGVEQLKEFLAAMTPFAAPGELKMAGERFGVSYESPNRQKDTGLAQQAKPEPSRERESFSEQKREAPQMGMQGMGTAQQQGMPPQMQMLKNLMMLQNMFSGGAQTEHSNNDPTALIRMLGALRQ